jgi:Cu/Zn superoxide dismutase
MKPQRMLAPLALLAVLGVVVAAAGNAASPARVGTATVGPYTTPHAGVVVDAGITGTAHLVTLPTGQALIRVSAEGLAPGGTYAAHVHFGACTDYLGHFRYDPAGPPTRGNEIWLDLDANAAGRASDEVVVPAFDLTQTLSLVVHQHSNTDVGVGPPGPRTACGDVVLSR